MELMERVKAECDKHYNGCSGCLLYRKKGCLCDDVTPDRWDIEAIRKALGEEKQKEIKVPDNWDAEDYAIYRGNTDAIMSKQDAIIECLEQIKEKLK